MIANLKQHEQEFYLETYKEYTLTDDIPAESLPSATTRYKSTVLDFMIRLLLDPTELRLHTSMKMEEYLEVIRYF